MALDVGGRELRVTSLDRVLYPETGTTKADLLGYYARVGPVMVEHLRDRLLHLHRYPEGVDGPRFWQKQCPDGRPDWLPTAPIWSRDKQAFIEYCLANEPAAVLWAVNIGSLELHTSLHTVHDLMRPTAIAFDLDPGEGVGLVECCDVGLRLRDLFAGAGLRSFAKTSGSKGLQVYVPLNTSVAYAETKAIARRVAEMLEARWPELIVSRMAKAARRGRVLIDWSQNTEHKSTVCAYSVRAKARPTVSTPVMWSEVEQVVEGGDPGALVFGMDDVLARVSEHGDLFADVLTRRQAWPSG